MASSHQPKIRPPHESRPNTRFDSSSQRVLRKQIKRLALVTTFEKLPRCIVGMEARLSAHFVSRTLRKMGFEPRIISSLTAGRSGH